MRIEPINRELNAWNISDRKKFFSKFLIFHLPFLDLPFLDLPFLDLPLPDFHFGVLVFLPFLDFLPLPVFDVLGDGVGHGVGHDVARFLIRYSQTHID